MKRAGFVLLSVGLLYLGGSCVSSGKTVLLAQKDPIALVSVVSNSDINWKDEEPIDPRNYVLLGRRALRDNPDLTIVSGADELINTAEKLFREAMADSGMIYLAENSVVLPSRAYGEARLNRNHLIEGEKVKPDGYRFIDYRDKNFPQALAAETGIQRCMFVEFNFVKFMASGVGKSGNFRGEVDMTILILDAKGKTIYKKTTSIRSSDSERVSADVYSHSGLIDLFETAITDVCDEFLYQLTL